MAIGLFILAVIIQLAVVLAIFLLSLSRVTGSIVALITVIVTAIISPWSLLLGRAHRAALLGFTHHSTAPITHYQTCL